jgi:hypothetical protein
MKDNEYRRRYEEYIRSPQWQKMRARKLEEAGQRCEHTFSDGDWDWLRKLDERRCPTTSGLHVHHKSYRYFEQEWSEDLRVLCPRHHALTHAMEAMCKRCRTTLFPMNEFDGVEHLVDPAHAVLAFFGPEFDELTAADIRDGYRDCNDVGNYCEMDHRKDSA